MPTPQGIPFGSLTGTLEGDQMLLQMEALAQQQQNALSQSAQAANQGAQQANQAYQQAAQAPPPDMAALQFLNTLGGGISEVLGNQGAAGRAQQRTEQSRAAQLQARAQNLQALRDVALQKAEEAQKAGDLATTEKYRRQYETLARQGELLDENRKRAQAIEDREAKQAFEAQQNALDRASRERTAQTRTETSVPYTVDDIQASVEDLAEGRTEIQNVSPAHGFRAAVQTALRSQGRRIMPRKVRDALNEIGSAETVVDEIEALSQQVNTAKANFADRGITGLRNVVNAMNQTSLAADLETARKSLAGNLARAVAAERGVLTNQDRQFAMEMVPDLWTVGPKAERDIARLRRFIKSKKDRAIQVYTTAGAGQGQPKTEAKTEAAPKAPTMVLMVSPSGKKKQLVPADKVAEGVKNGWKRSN